MHPHRFRLCGPLDVCATGVNDFDAARRDLGPGPGKTGSAPSADPAAALSPRTVWKKVRCHNRSIRYTSPADMAEKRMASTKRMSWAIFIQIRRERCTHHAVMMCVCVCACAYVIYRMRGQFFFNVRAAVVAVACWSGAVGHSIFMLCAADALRNYRVTSMRNANRAHSCRNGHI